VFVLGGHETPVEPLLRRGCSEGRKRVMERPMEGWAECRLFNSCGEKAVDSIAGVGGLTPDNRPSVVVLSLPGLSFGLSLHAIRVLIIIEEAMMS